MQPGIDFIGVSVGALVVSGTGEIFLTKRGENATNERGTWEIPGGKVRFGETLADAIRREMNEEYGIDLVLTYQFPAQNHHIPDERQHWVPTCFIARMKEGQTPRILEPDKCAGMGWFALDALPEPLSLITEIDITNYRKYLSGEDVNMIHS